MNDEDKLGLSLVVDNQICPIDSPEVPALIPEGIYHFKLISHETSLKFGKPRLIMYMAVVDMGDVHGTALPCYRNVDELKGKARKGGGFTLPRNGSFMMEHCKLLPDYNPRRDRISLNHYYNNVIVARVSSVKKNAQGKALPKQLWWSKVAELVRFTNEVPP